MVIASFHPLVGGAERQAQSLARALVGRGWRVRVLTRHPTRSGTRRSPSTEICDGVEIHRISTPLPGKLASLQYLLGGVLRAWRWRDVDVFHAHDIGTPGLLAFVIRLVTGGKSVVKLRTGSNVYRKRYPNRLKRQIFNLLLKLHSRVVVVSTDLEDFARECGVTPKRIIRIPNMVETSDFVPADRSARRKARGALGLPGRHTVILYVGRLEPVKGVDVLLRAWSMLPSSQRSQAHLVLVGDGSEGEELRQLAGRLGCGESVHFVGASDRVQDFYKAADIFVLPSRAEGLSNSLLEAMSAGLPVVATAVGGGNDLVTHDDTGILVRPDDPDALRWALQGLLSETSTLEGMGMRARERVRSVAGAEATLERWQTLYSELAS